MYAVASVILSVCPSVCPSVMLNDLQVPCWHYYALFHTVRHPSKPTASYSLNIDPYCQRKKCSRIIVLSSIQGMTHVVSTACELLVNSEGKSNRKELGSFSNAESFSFHEYCGRCWFQPCELSSPSWSSFSPPSNCVSGHVSTMRCMVCRWPQSQEGDWTRPHLCRLAWHGPWHVGKRLSRDHVWQGRDQNLVVE